MKRTKPLMPAEIKHIESLVRIAKNPKTSPERKLETYLKLAELAYEKPPEIVCYTFQPLVINGQRLDRCDTCGKRTDLIHCPDVDAGYVYCQDCCPVCAG